MAPRTGPVHPPIPPFPTLGGNGEYQLGGTADCEYVDTQNNLNVPGDESPTAYATTATINSTGDYQNDVCSTGWAWSNWNLPPVKEINGDLTSHGTGEVQILPSPGSSCTAPPGVWSFDVLGVFSYNR